MKERLVIIFALILVGINCEAISSDQISQCYASTVSFKNEMKYMITSAIADMKEENTAIKQKNTELEKTIEELKKTASLVETPMYNSEVIYYLDLYEAMDKGVISKAGDTNVINDTQFKDTEYYGQKLIGIGTGKQPRTNGLRVNIPEGYDIIWIMCGNSVNYEIGYQVSAESDTEDDLPFRMITSQNWRNEVSPDGSLSSHGWQYNKWYPFSLHKSGAHFISAYNLNHSHHAWIAGLAFGKNNYWSAAYVSAISLTEGINGGGKLERYPDWQNDAMAFFPYQETRSVNIPVIENGKDKLVYFVDHNNNWDQGMTSLFVNDKPVERPTTNYSNSFTRHNNARPYGLYTASKVPASFIPKGARFIKITVDMSGYYQEKNNSRAKKPNFNVRKIGTHDFYPNLQ